MESPIRMETAKSGEQPPQQPQRRRSLTSLSTMSVNFPIGGISAGGVPFHPPLRRVSRGPKVMVCPTDKPQRLLLPMISAPAGSTVTAAAGPASSTYSRPLPAAILLPSVAVGGEAQQHDSCYSSCSDSDHSNVSREASETIGCPPTVIAGEQNGADNEPAKQPDKSQPPIGDPPLSTEADCAVVVASVVNGGGGGEAVSSSTAAAGVVDFASARDFAVKLGYTEEQLTTVLDRLGREPMPEHDRILSELVRVGGKRSRNGVGGGAPRGHGHRVLTSSNSFAGLNSSCYSPRGGATPAAVDGVHKGLRSVVIDGSNLAMTHGQKEVFSCGGIKACVEFFLSRNHSDIKVFVPQFRRENPRADCPITDQQILLDLEAARILVWTPSRRVGGRRIVCHDDRYILKTALEKDAVIVSNDEYRDLIRENPVYRKLVEERLLMYSFVDGKFMPPEDPLGRHGPRLDQFLSKSTLMSSATYCPYGRKCTYGNKCKFFHSDRPGGIHVGVTERLISDLGRLPLSASASLSYEFGNTGVLPGRMASPMLQPFAGNINQQHHSSYLSSSLPHAASQHQLQPPTVGAGAQYFGNQPAATLHMRKHLAAMRASSVSLPLKSTNSALGGSGGNLCDPFDSGMLGGARALTNDWTVPAGMPPPGFEHMRPRSSQYEGYPGTESNSLNGQGIRRDHSRLVDECFNPKQTLSDPDIANRPSIADLDPHGLFGIAPKLRGHHTHLVEHAQLNRNMSAPAPFVSSVCDGGTSPFFTNDIATPPSSPLLVARLSVGGERKNSASDTQLNWLQHMSSTATGDSASSAASDADESRRGTGDVVGSGGVGEKALCRAGSTDSAFGSDGSSHCSNNYFVPSTAVWGASELSVASSLSPASAAAVATEGGTPTPEVGDRQKLFYHLSQLFNETVVTAVMNAHPEENNAQVLCSRILGVQKGFAASAKQPENEPFDESTAFQF